jgi:hypothetical protein
VIFQEKPLLPNAVPHINLEYFYDFGLIFAGAYSSRGRSIHIGVSMLCKE